MKIHVREGETTQQAILRTGRDKMEDSALDQGYRLGHGENIYDIAYKERQDELKNLLGRAGDVGKTALIMLGDGTIITQEEHKRNEELTG